MSRPEVTVTRKWMEENAAWNDGLAAACRMTGSLSYAREAEGHERIAALLRSYLELHEALKEINMVAKYCVAPDSPIWMHYEPEEKGDIPAEINKVRFASDNALASSPLKEE